MAMLSKGNNFIDPLLFAERWELPIQGHLKDTVGCNGFIFHIQIQTYLTTQSLISALVVA